MSEATSSASANARVRVRATRCASANQASTRSRNPSTSGHRLPSPPLGGPSAAVPTLNASKKSFIRVACSTPRLRLTDSERGGE